MSRATVTTSPTRRPRARLPLSTPFNSNSSIPRIVTPLHYLSIKVIPTRSSLRAVCSGYEFQSHTYDAADLGPTHCNIFTENMSQYNPTTNLHEQRIGRTQQAFATLLYYNHDQPVSPQPSPYQGPTEYLPVPYEFDTTATAPQLTSSGPTMFDPQVGQSTEGIPIQAEVPANQSAAVPQVPVPSHLPVLHMSQTLGSTSYRQADNGPRRILAAPIGSLSITDPTILGTIAGFQAASWMINQVEEPAPAGKSCYFQLIDELTMACRLCRKRERRCERLVSHVRGHFDHRPYPCGGQCGNREWYVC